MKEASESDSGYIRRCFSEAEDMEMLDEIDEQLRDEGFNKDTVRSYKSRRRKELQKKSGTSSPVVRAKSGGQLPAEQIVENLPWPVTANGQVDEAFVAGMKYEAMNMIRGIRLAQELNKMGLEQAKPVIEMAREMRQSESQAAQEVANELGQLTMQGNQQLLAAINALASQQSGQVQNVQPPEPVNPMTKMLSDSMQPHFQQVLQQFFSKVLAGSSQHGMTGTAPPAQAETVETAQSTEPGQSVENLFGEFPRNFTTHSIDELKDNEYEEFQEEE